MSRKLLGDGLFLIQIGFALTFGTSQFLQMLTSAEGVSMSWFGFWLIFLLLNLWLAWHAHKAMPSRVTFQTLIAYSTWTMVVTLDVSVIVFKQAWVWNDRDTLTAFIAIVGVLATLFWGRFELTNPLVKGFMAVFFKAIPQFILAWNIWLVGGAGMSWIAVIAGHATILSRIGQLVLSVKEASWDRNRTGSLISEVPNEISWIAVTLVLLLKL
ncbi:MAG: hypothetical protein AAB388_03455 [Patescibacteria group bacterium]